MPKRFALFAVIFCIFSGESNAAQQALLTQIQSVANETGTPPTSPSIPWLTVAANNASEEGIDIALERSEVATGTLTQAENIGYLYLDAGKNGTFIDANNQVITWESQLTGVQINGWFNGCSVFPFSNQYQSAPVVLAAQASRRGGDGGWLRRCSLDNQHVGLTIDEDRYRDRERSHTKEIAGLLAFSKPFVAEFNGAQGDNWRMEAGTITLPRTLNNPNFINVQFQQVYGQIPLVFVLPTEKGNEPASVRIRNVSDTDFEAAQVEPSGNDGPHVTMQVHYLAITPGSQSLPGDVRLTAGSIPTLAAQHGAGVAGARNWEHLSFETSFNVPPTAVLAADPVKGDKPLNVNFDASGSNDADGTISSYHWVFGDGATASESTTNYTYENAGTYTATLTVTDHEGAVDTKSIEIQVFETVNLLPTAVIGANPTTGEKPLRVDFDASESLDADGTVAEYNWDFGDGVTANGVDVNHLYTEEGTYSVTLTVVDNEGARDTDSVDIQVIKPQNVLPKASFTLNPTSGIAPLEVNFDASDSNDLDGKIDRYEWDFGDSSPPATGISTTHIYSEAGTFSATLTVTDNEGATDTTSISITIDEAPANQDPEASMTLSEDQGDAPLEIEFDASGSSDPDGSIEAYEWDFGDGTTGTGKRVTHTYTRPAEAPYTATLTVTDNEEATSTTDREIVVSQRNVLTPVEAARFLAQATFGPTVEGINHLTELGTYEDWLDEQFDAQASLQLPPSKELMKKMCLDSSVIDTTFDYARHSIWWDNILYGEDQLRQRVAFALSEILVISDVDSILKRSQFGMADYYDILTKHAFGNYRDLLAAITLHPLMGAYLSMVKNEKADIDNSVRPDENFARELMQLFTIGLHELQPGSGGQIRQTANGQIITTYDQEKVEEFAKVFTGWNYAEIGWDQRYPRADRTQPMVSAPWEAEYHEPEAKMLLDYSGVVNLELPAGQTARKDLEDALDNVFNHPNVGPFVSRLLIQRLVTSNPSNEYIARVAGTFNNNGAGVRGDLQAVVKAILLDEEARHGHITHPETFGKLREPLLRISHFWRAFDASPVTREGQFNGNELCGQGEYTFHRTAIHLPRIERLTGQSISHSPSVFNFFLPDYSPPGNLRTEGLVAPEFQILTDNTIVDTSNLFYKIIHVTKDGSFKGWTFIDLDEEFNLVSDPDALLDHLNLILMSGSMPEALRGYLRDHLNSPDFPSHGGGTKGKVRDAIYLIVMSPEYLIQK